jgi:hypothetical protein
MEEWKLAKAGIVRSLVEAEKAWNMSIDELVSYSGEAMGHGYPKNSSTLEVSEKENDWARLSGRGKIADERVEELEAGARPSNHEMALLREARISHGLEEPDIDVIPGIYFCKSPEADTDRFLIVVTAWGYSFMENRRELFGEFKSDRDAYRALDVAFYLDFGPSSYFDRKRSPNE